MRTPFADTHFRCFPRLIACRVSPPVCPSHSLSSIHPHTSASLCALCCLSTFPPHTHTQTQAHAHTARPSPLTSCFHCSMKTDLYHVQPLLPPRDKRTNSLSRLLLFLSLPSVSCLSPQSHYSFQGVFESEFYWTHMFLNVGQKLENGFMTHV